MTIAKEHVKKFYEELAANKQLHGKLQKALEEYDGNKEDRNSVVEEVLIPVAKGLCYIIGGYGGTAADVDCFSLCCYVGIGFGSRL